MTTIDFRARPDRAVIPVDPVSFVADYAPERVERNGAVALRSADRQELPSLTLEVDGESVTIERSLSGLAVRSGSGGDLVVALGTETFAELVHDAVSTFGAEMTGRAEVRRGEVDEFIGWEPVWRTLLDGRPAYDPGSIDFRDRAGAPLDLHRSFGPDDDPAEIGHFLGEAGFLHLRGVFTAEEMAAVSADLDRAMEEAERDDGASWWARDEAGEWKPSRILGFNHRSAALCELLSTGRFSRIATFTDDEFVQRDPFAGDAAEGLHKRVGIIEGISDVSWHKDCAMGGHSRKCCGLVTGISVTSAGPENGELGVVAGSHRANIAALGVEQIALPRVPVPTETGDVTVHCSCTLHMSRPPVTAERRVVYTGFGLAPLPEDDPVVLDAETRRKQRASLNDHVRRHQHAESAISTRRANFEL